MCVDTELSEHMHRTVVAIDESMEIKIAIMYVMLKADNNNNINCT